MRLAASYIPLPGGGIYKIFNFLLHMSGKILILSDNQPGYKNKL
jgi:hypothetical protein